MYVCMRVCIDVGVSTCVCITPPYTVGSLPGPPPPLPPRLDTDNISGCDISDCATWWAMFSPQIASSRRNASPAGNHTEPTSQPGTPDIKPTPAAVHDNSKSDTYWWKTPPNRCCISRSFQYKQTHIAEATVYGISPYKVSVGSGNRVITQQLLFHADKPGGDFAGFLSGLSG